MQNDLFPGNVALHPSPSDARDAHDVCIHADSLGVDFLPFLFGILCGIRDPSSSADAADAADAAARIEFIEIFKLFRRRWEEQQATPFFWADQREASCVRNG